MDPHVVAVSRPVGKVRGLHPHLDGLTKHEGRILRRRRIDPVAFQPRRRPLAAIVEEEAAQPVEIHPARHRVDGIAVGQQQRIGLFKAGGLEECQRGLARRHIGGLGRRLANLAVDPLAQRHTLFLKRRNDADRFLDPDRRCLRLAVPGQRRLPPQDALPFPRLGILGDHQLAKVQRRQLRRRAILRKLPFPVAGEQLNHVRRRHRRRIFRGAPLVHRMQGHRRRHVRLPDRQQVGHDCTVKRLLRLRGLKGAARPFQRRTRRAAEFAQPRIRPQRVVDRLRPVVVWELLGQLRQKPVGIRRHRRQRTRPVGVGLIGAAQREGMKSAGETGHGLDIALDPPDLGGELGPPHGFHPQHLPGVDRAVEKAGAVDLLGDGVAVGIRHRHVMRRRRRPLEQPGKGQIGIDGLVGIALPRRLAIRQRRGGHPVFRPVEIGRQPLAELRIAPAKLLPQPHDPLEIVADIRRPPNLVHLLNLGPAAFRLGQQPVFPPCHLALKDLVEIAMQVGLPKIDQMLADPVAQLAVGQRGKPGQPVGILADIRSHGPGPLGPAFQNRQQLQAQLCTDLPFTLRLQEIALDEGRDIGGHVLCDIGGQVGIAVGIGVDRGLEGDVRIILAHIRPPPPLRLRKDLCKIQRSLKPRLQRARGAVLLQDLRRAFGQLLEMLALASDHHRLVEVFQLGNRLVLAARRLDGLHLRIRALRISDIAGQRLKRVELRRRNRPDPGAVRRKVPQLFRRQVDRRPPVDHPL